MSTIIQYNPENLVPSRRSIFAVTNKLMLKPGTNTLTAGNFTILKKKPYYKDYLESNVIQVLSTVSDENITKDKKVANISSLASNESTALIGKETSLKVLKEWQEQEGSRSNTRSTVLNAISRRITAINDGNV